MTQDTTSVTLPAFAADTLGESLVVQVPTSWAERVHALAAFCRYGPQFRRSVVEALVDVDRCVRDGYTVFAYDHLVAAERLAGVAGPPTEQDGTEDGPTTPPTAVESW